MSWAAGPFSELLINNNGYGTMPQAGIDPPAQSHASDEASALPPSHQGWIKTNIFLTIQNLAIPGLPNNFVLKTISPF